MSLQAQNNTTESEEMKMLTYVDAIKRTDTITIDGYTSNKTEKGIIKDVARAVEKYDKAEADLLRSFLKDKITECNTPFVKPKNSDGGYFFEYEEVHCASRWDDEMEEMEYKDGYHHYFCIRIIK